MNGYSIYIFYVLDVIESRGKGFGLIFSFKKIVLCFLNF